MDDVTLPKYVDLMYPTLQALAVLGGEGSSGEIEKRVIDIAQLSSEQLEVSFPDSSKHKDSKVHYKLAWARSYLKKLAAVENTGRGTWRITAVGRNFLALEDGDGEIRHREHELRVGKSPEIFLKSLSERTADGQSVEMTVRDFLNEWGVRRRGSSVVVRVERDLAEHDISTIPRFDQVGIDQIIAIRATSSMPSSGEGSSPTSDAADGLPNIDSSQEHTITVGTLSSAGGGLASVVKEDTIRKAQSIMESRDFSQLAVTSGGRQLHGAISWESIAQTQMYGATPEFVKDAMEPNPVLVRDSDPLLDQVQAIADNGYIFVRDAHNELKGIVTSADLSSQFALLANPFLLIGEIERWLRTVVDGTLEADDLAAFADPDDVDREIDGAQHLTFGEYHRILQNPDVWDQIGWTVDRNIFCQHLEHVRDIRNAIMHFSPDPIEPDELAVLENMLQWIRRLTAT